MRKPTLNKKATSKVTLTQLQHDYQISRYVLDKCRIAGVDIYCRESVKAKILSNRSRPPAWVNGCPWDNPGDKKNTAELEKEERDLMDQVLAATDYDTARTLKTKIDALYKLRQIDIQNRDYIHIDDIKEDMTRIGNGVKAGLLRLQSDFPPMLAGLGESEIQRKVKPKVLELLSQLADETSDLYKPANQWV